VTLGSLAHQVYKVLLEGEMTRPKLVGHLMRFVDPGKAYRECMKHRKGVRGKGDPIVVGTLRIITYTLNALKQRKVITLADGIVQLTPRGTTLAKRAMVQ